VLVRLDEERNIAIVRIDARPTELAIPASMRPTRDRTPVPPVTPTPTRKSAKHPA